MENLSGWSKGAEESFDSSSWDEKATKEALNARSNQLLLFFSNDGRQKNWRKIHEKAILLVRRHSGVSLYLSTREAKVQLESLWRLNRSQLWSSRWSIGVAYDDTKEARSSWHREYSSHIAYLMTKKYAPDNRTVSFMWALR